MPSWIPEGQAGRRGAGKWACINAVSRVRGGRRGFAVLGTEWVVFQQQQNSLLQHSLAVPARGLGWLLLPHRLGFVPSMPRPGATRNFAHLWLQASRSLTSTEGPRVLAPPWARSGLGVFPWTSLSFFFRERESVAKKIGRTVPLKHLRSSDESGLRVNEFQQHARPTRRTSRAGAGVLSSVPGNEAACSLSQGPGVVGGRLLNGVLKIGLVLSERSWRSGGKRIYL